jgi:hypothetical protein
VSPHVLLASARGRHAPAAWGGPVIRRRYRQRAIHASDGWGSWAASSCFREAVDQELPSRQAGVARPIPLRALHFSAEARILFLGIPTASSVQAEVAFHRLKADGALANSQTDRNKVRGPRAADGCGSGGDSGPAPGGSAPFLLQHGAWAGGPPVRMLATAPAFLRLSWASGASRPRHGHLHHFSRPRRAPRVAIGEREACLSQQGEQVGSIGGCE